MEGNIRLPENLDSEQLCSGHHTSTILSSDSERLSVSMWLAENPIATLFYIHGIQSHAGWLFETGPHLSARGINVIAVDRRGSGKSGGTRGHADSADQLLRDYRQAIVYARELSGSLPFIVIGQSFGGSLLAALLCRYNINTDAIIFSAPALGQQRLRHDLYELNRRRATKGKQHFPIGLRDAEYSSEDKYLRFLANDALINRSITASMASTLVEIEDIYFDNKQCLEVVGAPVHLITPKYDAIINMDVSHKTLARHIPLTLHKIDTHSHYMEFSNKRYTLWQTIERICTGGRHDQA